MQYCIHLTSLNKLSEVIPYNGVCLVINILIEISILINKAAAIFKVEL
jgi:hypothetical protein